MFFPFMMDIAKKRIVIIGGGEVAYRKFCLFKDFGAEICIVSPELSPLFNSHIGEFHFISDYFCTGYLKDAFAVIAASDNRVVNRTAAEYCRKEHIHVNAVDDIENCSFIVPAVLQQGDLTIGICTGGNSPAFAGKIKKQIRSLIGNNCGEKLTLLGKIKAFLRASEPIPEKRREYLIGAANMEIDELSGMLKKLEKEYSSN